MDTFQTSFIPKKPIMPSQGVVETDHPRMSFFLFLSILLLVSTLLGSAGLYIYKISLVKKINSLQSSLSIAKDSFQVESISQLQVFDRRMNASKQILASHTVLSPFFTLLSDLTVPTIQFTKLNLELGVDGKNYIVRMSGLARDYKAIAVQAEVFNSNKGKYFKDVVFSNLVLKNEKTNKGYVGFDIVFSLDPALVSYDKSILTSNQKAQ